MVTIEATIALTTFLFMFIMIFSIITMCRAQARVQVALNNTAQEISQYSYIYGMTGMDKSLSKFKDSANESKETVDEFIGKTITAFDSIQALGDDVKSVNFDNADLNSMLESWEKISKDINKSSENVSVVQQEIETMAKDPKKLLFGMAKIIGSEGLSVASSKLIAEPIARALVPKHLKRSENDTADAFCKSVGIVPGSYFGKTSYFNGIDFANSELFANKNGEIKLVATYKIKMLQLIPIDLQFTITQTAVTKGWLHGNLTGADSSEKASDDKTEEKKDTAAESIWNSDSFDQYSSTIKKEELNLLKESGFYGVSGETNIQAYDPDSNTAALISTCNPVFNESGTVDEELIKEHVDFLVEQIKSATDNKTYINIKVNDPQSGSIKTEKCELGGRTLGKKIVLVVPEDAGVKDSVDKIVKEKGYSDMFEVKAKHGTGKPLNESESKKDTEEKENGT